MKGGPDWTVVDSVRQVLRCERCGKEKGLDLPAPVDAFVFDMKAFAARHQDCKEGAKP